MAKEGIDYDVIDRTSRPGYVKIKMRDDGSEFWAERKTEPDPPGTEYGYPTHEQLVALGMLRGMKTKEFSDMTEEERKLFTNTENDENSNISEEN